MLLMKKRIIIISVISVAAIIILVPLIAITHLFYGMSGGSFKHFAKYSSTSKENHISIKAKDPVWSFGSQEFKITLDGKGCKKQIITAYLSNDGKQSQDGVEVKTEFTDDTHAVIIFDGEEQKPEIIEIFFDKTNKITEIVRTNENLS